MPRNSGHRSYPERIELGLTKGRSRAEARGHGRRAPVYDRHLEEGVRLKRDRPALSLDAVAHQLGVAPERLRAYYAQSGVFDKRRGRWQMIEDNRPRVVPIYSRGRPVEITVPNLAAAVEAGRYWHVVHNEFLDTNDRRVLAPFEGHGLRDVRGRFYPYETRPNELYRLTASGPQPYEQIYRIVAIR